ncbi:LacI family DNA-binding transcriptional regulator [Arenibacter sp. F26102]|uniref:LacI family DNA-binding transcriptional regulator n=1 Tax=Arenibacter sp. F26102 TaxID=2926416 RepID=UPI001FF20469|nr:LacI family DNA-binding transcriptional regulator [Arenibacter sp. F26102]MCK0145513.1 LacI family DNA-binding transcriptional regulator [Arenibacter sp. F26102]
MNIKEKYTIKDIAHMAGVSKGTVDRVLHKRGKVSKKAFEKVDKVLKEIDYKPNPIARNLKINKTYNIHVLLPDPLKDPYWIPANEGIIEASNQFMPFGVMVRKYFYDPNDRTSFLDESRQAIISQPDVLLMAPIFDNESHEVLKHCCENKISVVLFNNHINSFKEQIFIGQDLNQSGRVAASLMNKIIGKNDEISIIHINKEPHMQQKENGFKEFFKEKSGNNHLVISKEFNSAEKRRFNKDVSEFLKSNKSINAFFVTNSKAYVLIEAFKELEIRERIVIGYDLLKPNMKYLKEGAINFLIHQKPHRQAYLGVSCLAEHFLFGKGLPTQEFLPIDIVTSENAQYYL